MSGSSKKNTKNARVAAPHTHSNREADQDVDPPEEQSEDSVEQRMNALEEMLGSLREEFEQYKVVLHHAGIRL